VQDFSVKNILQNGILERYWGLFYKNVDFTWRVSWLWRISGGHRRRCCEWFI